MTYSTAAPAEYGGLNGHYANGKVESGFDGYANDPSLYLDNDPIPHPDPRAFQDTWPGYVGRDGFKWMDSYGQPEPLAQVAPAPGSENLSQARYEGQVGGHNHLFMPDGPVTGQAASGWTGTRTAIPRASVGNSGPVSGGRDGAQQAQQAYFASQAAYFSQQASDAAMVAAL